MSGFRDVLAEWMEDPEFRAMIEAHRRRDRRANLLVGWTRHIPVVGRLVYVFWFGLLTEGLVDTCKPRWGALTFAFLNDGIKPSLWHTVYEVTHDNMAPYAGLYLEGSPRSRAEAEARR